MEMVGCGRRSSPWFVMAERFYLKSPFAQNALHTEVLSRGRCVPEIRLEVRGNYKVPYKTCFEIIQKHLWAKIARAGNFEVLSHGTQIIFLDLFRRPICFGR